MDTAFCRRTTTIAAVLGVIAAALYLGWGWLAAAGLTSLIIGLLPCAAMCGLGLSANRFAGRGGAAGCRSRTDDAAAPASAVPAASASHASNLTSRTSS